MVRAGLRVREACDLRLDDVVLNARGSHVAVIGKRKKHREVPLNAGARQALREWLEARPDVDHDFLLAGRDDQPLQPRGVQRRVVWHVRRAGLEDVTPHALRHTFGRPFGRLVNSSLDETCCQKQVSSPWRFRAPSRSGLVSFQGTGASREREADLQEANVQEGWKGLVGYWQRRDMTKARLAYAVYDARRTVNRQHRTPGNPERMLGRS